ncbi:unnamed protein product [Diatraea saccharalis]|uniref:Uncharacterized protein n=1 Tax=Diatraea saccharalis TaxID=40085 RepID=A0A9N9WAM3_9NEOP|nr:unnamed protein product [Diatraea saccharalis]
MRTMAGFVIFSVVVASLLEQVFAINCLSISLEKIMNCNDCIRCGGYWCNKPGEKNGEHCSAHRHDNWCPGVGNLEELPAIEETKDSTPGDIISPRRYAVTANVDKPSPRIEFIYEWSSQTNPSVSALNFFVNFSPL